MRRHRDEPSAVRVYTVCDESKYLIVRNVPSLGCGDELFKLFASFGDVEECKPMDAEDSEPFTDVYWIKFSQISNARFAKRKLDEFVFLGNRLQVSYAPQYESFSDTKEKLECRQKDVLARLKPGRIEGSKNKVSDYSHDSDISRQHKTGDYGESGQQPQPHVYPHKISHVSSNKDYFESPSMNNTVNLVRQKLDKIQSCHGHPEPTPATSKKPRVDNRRRI